MNSPLTLSPSQARKIALSAQSLNSRREFGTGVSGTLAAIQHLGYVQIDTLAVVERAHNHTLWNRVDGFKPEFIDQLQHEGQIYEHWAHALAYLPISDFRYSLPMMNRIAKGENHWYPKNPKHTKRVLKRIQEEGPLSVKDFSDKKSSTAMWSRSPSKHALEQLFMEGKLMIPRRVNFHKVYDLTERVLGSEIDVSMPTDKELCCHLTLKFLKANGIGHVKEFSYLRKGLGHTFKTVVNELHETGKIIPVSINSGETLTGYYCLPESLNLLGKNIPNGLVRILSPFDNAIIQRKRLEQLFGYDYQIECYVPQAKRKYGYFCLPIVYNAGLVGRIDAKADRKDHTLHVINLYIEKPVRSIERFYGQLHKEIKRFAKFNQCENIKLHGVNGAHRPDW